MLHAWLELSTHETLTDAATEIGCTNTAIVEALIHNHLARLVIDDEFARAARAVDTARRPNKRRNRLRRAR